MKFVLYAALLVVCRLQNTALGFSPSGNVLRQRSCARLHTNLCSSPSPNLGGQESGSITDEDEGDDDFKAMQAEIAAMMAADSTAGVTTENAAASISVADIGKYNKLIAVASAVLGSCFFVFQHSQPVSGVALMHAMEKDSMDINVAVCNGKPTVIDFYADWCESCKVMAPSMRSVETQYKDKINFIAIDGSNSKNAEMVKRFRVDGIPHLAFIGSDQEVKTALVGSVPKTILRDQMQALMQGKTLPYEGYDAFEEESHFPLGYISKTCAIKP